MQVLVLGEASRNIKTLVFLLTVGRFLHYMLHLLEDVMTVKPSFVNHMRLQKKGHEENQQMEKNVDYVKLHKS